LARALEVFGLQAVPYNSPDAADARADPTTQQAFICNLQARRVLYESMGWVLATEHASCLPAVAQSDGYSAR